MTTGVLRHIDPRRLMISPVMERSIYTFSYLFVGSSLTHVKKEASSQLINWLPYVFHPSHQLSAIRNAQQLFWASLFEKSIRMPLGV